MGLRSFKSEEQSKVATFPNLLTLVRGAGGLALFGFLATKNIDPVTALESVAFLSATDAEGLTITATGRWPRLQKALRIIPSALGRVWDPVMDKVLAISFFSGATIGGDVPIWEAAGILATETATTGATFVAVGRGNEPETSKIGTLGMLARCEVMVTDLAAEATQSGFSHEMFAVGGATGAIAAVAMGALSCRDIIKNYW